MTWLKGLHPHSWWLAYLSIVGLLVAIAVAGLLALGLNERVRDVLLQAIQYDLEIEDRADDLRVAVLDVRHYHRNLIFGSHAPRELTDFETAYQQLLLRIDELERLVQNQATISVKAR